MKVPYNERGLKVGDRRGDGPAHDLDGPDPLDVHQDPEHRLRAHLSETAELLCGMVKPGA